MHKIIPKAPVVFDGSLEEFYEQFARDVLLSPARVEQFHHALVKYLSGENPLYLIRMNNGQTRGEIVRTDSGRQLRPTDNSPAWWIHANLFLNEFRPHSFDDFIENVPWHMFSVRLKQSVNRSGWHVAHIFGVKDKEIRDSRDLALRMVRNIHPCNYFYVPTSDWRRYGGDETVISFFHQKFRNRYKSVWKEFLSLAGGMPLSTSEVKDYRFVIGRKDDATKSPDKNKAARKVKATDSGSTYKFSRFCFKASVIEPLQMNDVFTMITPPGNFKMTKADFYSVFPRIRESRSYREKGIHHFPQIPKSAEQFRTTN